MPKCSASTTTSASRSRWTGFSKACSGCCRNGVRHPRRPRPQFGQDAQPWLEIDPVLAAAYIPTVTCLRLGSGLRSGNFRVASSPVSSSPSAGASLHDDLRERVRDATDIVDLVGSYIALRRSGKGLAGLCPWHDDSRPSLQV
ncbi:hypothetical protein EBR04_08445, partial [bacterium]|nr:hypothetical protein [bacterium]